MIYYSMYLFLTNTRARANVFMHIRTYIRSHSHTHTFTHVHTRTRACKMHTYTQLYKKNPEVKNIIINFVVGGTLNKITQYGCEWAIWHITRE